MKKALPLALLAVLTAAACAKAASREPDPTTEEQKTLYALGLFLSDNISVFNLSEAELGYVKAGLADGVLRRARKVELAAYAPKLQELAQSRASAGAGDEKKTGAAFLLAAAAQKGAIKTPAGFVIQEIAAGTGPSPKATDKVKVHYKGTLIDGTVFDSSLDRGAPAVFPVSGVIPCWTQALQMMRVGGKSRLVCPAELAYGDRGAPPRIKPGATLVFEVNLIEIVK